jgi:DNA repair exonuclease SbcCD ATPase subunit
LEEVLFNKNSKGIKKADILNRYIKDKQYSIELDLEKDGVEYSIKTTRGNTQTVKLLKDSRDISAHTATQTYKMIEDIIGIDHKSFSQIVYQSSANSLEFLMAADTARKKFLIEILNLGKYTRAAEVFKEVAQDLSKDISAAQSQVNTVKQWLDKYSGFDTTPKVLVSAPQLDEDSIATSKQLSSTLQTIEQTNRKIQQNNTYKQLQARIQLVPVPAKPVGSAEPLQTEKIKLDKTVQDSQAFIKKMQALHGTCPTC